MSTSNWTLEKSLCRCCHSEGDFKSLADSYFDSGYEEVYANIIRECFSIDLFPVSGELSTITHTICDPCILALLDAAKFKKQVLDCEEKFLKLHKNNAIKVELELTLKKELENSSDEDEVICLESDSDDLRNDEAEYLDDEEEVKYEPDVPVRKKAKKPPPPPAKPRVRPQQAEPKARQQRKKPQPEKAQQVSKPKEKDEKSKGYIRSSYYNLDVTKDGSKNYTCLYCTKIYTSARSINQHYRHVHLRLRPKLISCRLCDIRVPGHQKAFHLEKVHGIPAPKCNACGKKFAYPNQVLRHQKHDHMGEKMFTCQVCDMKFVSNYYLSRHSITHTELRVHECKYCNKTFRWKKNMLTHMAIHLDDRRHVCSICAESFVQQSSLTYHISRKHPDIVE